MPVPKFTDGPVNLMFVDIKDDTQSNKYYNMIPQGGTFTVEYGRFGSTKATMSYPSSKWDSIYKSKLKKGYKDITNLKKAVKELEKNSGR